MSEGGDMMGGYDGGKKFFRGRVNLTVFILAVPVPSWKLCGI